MVNFVLKFLPYWVSVEKINMKEWRGHTVPLTLYVRLHYRTGNRIWFYLCGQRDFSNWAKNIR